MDREDLHELHYLTPICNVPSIMQHGLLSHERAAKFKPASIAMEEIQDRRSLKTVPGGQKLHQYVNLYICARNPMLFKRRDRRDELCVLAVSPEVLDLSGVVVTDGNASGDYVRFSAAPAGLSVVDKELTFAEYWTDNDQIRYFQRKSAKCAEVLVPHRVDPRYLLRAYVWHEKVGERLRSEAGPLPVAVNGHLFFA